MSQVKMAYITKAGHIPNCLTSYSIFDALYIWYKPLLGIFICAGQQQKIYPGIEFIGDPISEIITCRATTVATEDEGIIVSFPEGTVKDSVEVIVSKAVHGSFEFPPGCQPVSPVYLIEPSLTQFQYGVTVKIKHHATLKSSDDCEKLTFMSAESIPLLTESGPVYVFKRITRAKGVFKPDCPYGVITLGHYCFCCVCFYYPSQPHTYQRVPSDPCGKLFELATSYFYVPVPMYNRISY